eukprot:TRINITY_DN489_c0_g1_i1.p1 TRINITY_DN489_c0_g1~~TRINITY_DN489_c0_g1_i1.p1  ORF type:complete len:125 (+),score=5.79 TRINITY_DN489_c0_g1_i1:648-1022(+)
MMTFLISNDDQNSVGVEMSPICLWLRSHCCSLLPPVFHDELLSAAYLRILFLDGSLQQIFRQLVNDLALSTVSFGVDISKVDHIRCLGRPNVPRIMVVSLNDVKYAAHLILLDTEAIYYSLDCF